MLISTLAFLSGINMVAMGDNIGGARDIFACQDPAFAITREDGSGLLQATIQTPQQGFYAQLIPYQPQGYEMMLVVNLGQPAAASGGYGRGLPALGEVKIDQRFEMPDHITQVRLQIQGLTPQPTVMMCSLAARG